MKQPDALLQALREALGETHVLVADASDALARHLVDWRKRYQGSALAVVRPADAAQVAAVVKLCARFGASIVPQGGNTSLVGGAVPDDSGAQIVLSLSRLHRVLRVDPANLSITVEAGCLLADVQSAAADAGLLFPLSLASEGTCTIGGNLATNAGGTQVLRYGTARELCLGLEAVTAQGQIWHGLQGLRKDNTGYDLRHLLIGSEGTLGIITAATLRLYPQPKGQATALLACPDMSAAVAVLQRARDVLDAGLTAYEVMARLPLQLVQRHHPDVASVMSALCAETDVDAEGALPAWTVLIDNHSSESDAHAQQRLQALLEQAMADGLVTNATLASNTTQRQAMWRLRETIPLSERAEGLMVKHDIGVPTSAMAAFVSTTEQAIMARWPQARIVCFGHLGDGNLHYNVQPPPGQQAGEALLAFERAVNKLVFDEVQYVQGTLSAEHGIGVLRRGELARRKPAAALSMMRAIKQALDPAGTLNPGRVLD
ncbi:MAG: FAD-binding oxidoreductase [Aquabacterium sp.]